MNCIILLNDFILLFSIKQVVFSYVSPFFPTDYPWQHKRIRNKSTVSDWQSSAVETDSHSTSISTLHTSAYDISDSYLLALYGWRTANEVTEQLNNNVQLVTKSVKVKKTQAKKVALSMIVSESTLQTVEAGRRSKTKLATVSAEV